MEIKSKPLKYQDKMKQTAIILLTCLCIACSCKTESPKDEAPVVLSKSEYPRIIDSLRLNELYNETKWLMYCYQCDDTLKIIKSDTLKDLVTFGMLELKFDTVDVYDTMFDIRFNFYYKGIPCTGENIRSSPIWGMVYAHPTGKKLNYVVQSGNMNYMRDSCAPKGPCRSRFVNPLQPEVVKYINDNKAKLNPWFYNEAKKRGVLKD
jgi:hypothetical protein